MPHALFGRFYEESKSFVQLGIAWKGCPDIGSMLMVGSGNSQWIADYRRGFHEADAVLFLVQKSFGFIALEVHALIVGPADLGEKRGTHG